MLTLLAIHFQHVLKAPLGGQLKDQTKWAEQHSVELNNVTMLQLAQDGQFLLQVAEAFNDGVAGWLVGGIDIHILNCFCFMNVIRRQVHLVLPLLGESLESYIFVLPALVASKGLIATNYLQPLYGHVR